MVWPYSTIGLGNSRSRPVEMMHRSEKLVTAATEEPMDVAEAKDWCRVNTSVDKEDETFKILIAAARGMVETETHRKLITSTWEVIYDRFPGPYGGEGVYGLETYGVIELPYGVTQSVESINYLDAAGDSTLLASSEYIVDLNGEPARITPARDKFWPATDLVIDSVTVQFVSGYGGAAAVPAELKQLIKLLVADMYSHREAQYEIILRENRLYSNIVNNFRLPSFVDVT